jgi:hypothetical protein
VALAGAVVAAVAWQATATVAQEGTPWARTIDRVAEPRPFDGANVDLTGTWKDPGDGIYYVGQHDRDVWWSGMSGRGGPADLVGRNWSNVARGTLGDDLVLEIDWADVPRAHHTASGTVWAQVGSDRDGSLQLRLIRDTGGSDVPLWTPCSVVTGTDPAELPPDGAFEADLAAGELAAQRVSAGDAATLAGPARLIFDAGRFAIEADFAGDQTCDGSL